MKKAIAGVLAGLVSLAAVQGVDADVTSTIRHRLNAEAQKRGVSQAHPVAEPHFAALADRAVETFEFTARVGQAYMVAAACDSRCDGMVLEIHDLEGSLVAARAAKGGLVVVTTPETRFGRFVVRMRMEACDAGEAGQRDPCVLGGAVYRM